MGQPSVNDFYEDLAYSQEGSSEEFWEAVYRKAFPTMQGMTLNDGNNPGQYRGIDRFVNLSSGKTLKIDEKKRRVEYQDILLEVISNDQKKTAGWIKKDLEIDYLAYAFMESRRCYIFDWELLRRAWAVNKKDWVYYARNNRCGYRIVIAKNRYYNTISLAVPIYSLLVAVENAMIIDVANTKQSSHDAQLSLPYPVEQRP